MSNNEIHATPPESGTAETGHSTQESGRDSERIPVESNDKLIAFGVRWRLDGDWLVCRSCNRPIIASADHQGLFHGYGCRYSDHRHPWAELRGLIALGSRP